MNKISKILATIAISIGFLSHQLQALTKFEELALLLTWPYWGAAGAILAPPYITYATITMAANAVAESAQQNKASMLELENLYTKTHSLIQNNLPEALEDRIDALINQKIPVSKHTSQQSTDHEVFQTNKAKIFVLQNIEDFLTLDPNPQYKNLNTFVFETCSKKINELERASQILSDQIKLLYNAIDDARSTYMQKYEISATTLKNMPQQVLDQKITNISNQIKHIIKEFFIKDKEFKTPSSHTPQQKEKIKVFFVENDVKFRALLSIYVHLLYKKSQEKQAMFVNIAAAFQSKGYTLEPAAPQQQQPFAPQAAKKTIWSQLRSWWYGNK